jgi:hypothetical protein
MRSILAKALSRFASWVSPKSIPSPPISTGSTYDTYRRRREPLPRELDNPDLWILLNFVLHLRRHAIAN